MLLSVMTISAMDSQDVPDNPPGPRPIAIEVFHLITPNGHLVFQRAVFAQPDVEANQHPEDSAVLPPHHPHPFGNLPPLMTMMALLSDSGLMLNMLDPNSEEQRDRRNEGDVPTTETRPNEIHGLADKDKTCSICIDLEIDYALPCGHTFCDPCVKKFCSLTPDNLRCPNCRHRFDNKYKITDEDRLQALRGSEYTPAQLRHHENDDLRAAYPEERAQESQPEPSNENTQQINMACDQPAEDARIPTEKPNAEEDGKSVECGNSTDDCQREECDSGCSIM